MLAILVTAKGGLFQFFSNFQTDRINLCKNRSTYITEKFLKRQRQNHKLFQNLQYVHNCCDIKGRKKSSALASEDSNDVH